MNRVPGWIALLLIGAIALSFTVYVRDMRRAYARIDGRSTVVDSPYGEIEFTEGGSGPPVLVIHGSGGGFDQGEMIARAVLGDEFRWIAPSRFGYLQSTFRPGATFDDQAHAYAFLLDHLGVENVAVVTLSHGGPSALLFAVLHPDRVSSLTLISAGVASSNVEDRARANRKGDVLATIFRHDPLYWGITRMFRKQFMKLMGADETVIASLTPYQRELVDEIIDGMNPVSLRSAGAALDNKAAMPNERIAGIVAPTLVIHAGDDSLQLIHNAEFAAEVIPGARLARFDRGGHLLLSVEQPAIREMTQRHILEHWGE